MKFKEAKTPVLAVKPLKELELPKLTEEQEDTISEIYKNPGKSVLIHGDTSTGKTRIYIELIKRMQERKCSSIIMTPEIGLTPQLIKTLEESFPTKVILVHSSLGDKTKRDNWIKIISSQEPLIIVGPRSALFSPLNNIGLIVMDEAHEPSYKQEQSPYYQTSRVAAQLAKLSNAILVMGTATPLISDYFVLNSKKSVTTRMVKPAVSGSKRNFEKIIQTVKITDKSHFSKSNWLSNELLDSITNSLQNNEQSIIFLNRRGSAQVILCQNCGWQALCPNCDTSLTYHSDKHIMLCHSCSYNQTVPQACPVCTSPDIVFKGTGTKSITDEISRLFNTAKVRRFDRDNKKADSLEQNYDDLLNGKIDIAVGTQIITKGLDLPKLSTVGIVMADSGLYFPDYMAEERTYQNLTQVIGRVGRGHVPGRVIIQTYNPESIAIKAATENNYKEFYEQQITEREKYQFPPFVFLLKITTKRSTQKSSESACLKLINEIRGASLPVIINGPTPAFHEKQGGKYVWQIIIKSKERTSLLKIIDMLPTNFAYDIDPSSLL